MSIHRSLAVLLLVGVAACGDAGSFFSRRALAAEPERSVTSVTPVPDTAHRAATPLPQPPRRSSRPRLSPLADSIGRSLTLAPTSQTWFTAAGRGKRLLVDVGRADAVLGSGAERKAAFADVVRHRAPLAVGTRVRVHGPWGADDAVIESIGIWSNRIVATLSGSSRVDSVARRVEPLIASVARAEVPTEPSARGCDRSPPDSVLAARASYVRDSIARAILAREQPRYERLEQSLRIAGSRVPGCFGVGRILLIVSVRAGGFEWVRERFVVVGDSGAVYELQTPVYRHRAHDGVAALDADGDGVDDLAVRVMTDGSGSLAILRLEEGRRLVRLTSGFTWGN